MVESVCGSSSAAVVSAQRFHVVLRFGAWGAGPGTWGLGVGQGTDMNQDFALGKTTGFSSFPFRFWGLGHGTGRGHRGLGGGGEDFALR